MPGTRYRPILQPSLWLPASFKFAFRAPDVTGEETWIGATSALTSQLELLNRNTFGASEAELRSFLEGEGATGDEVEEAAKVGLSMILALSREASAARVPLLLSF